MDVCDYMFRYVKIKNFHLKGVCHFLLNVQPRSAFACLIVTM